MLDDFCAAAITTTAQRRRGFVRRCKDSVLVAFPTTATADPAKRVRDFMRRRMDAVVAAISAASTTTSSAWQLVGFRWRPQDCRPAALSDLSAAAAAAARWRRGLMRRRLDSVLKAFSAAADAAGMLELGLHAEAVGLRARLLRCCDRRCCWSEGGWASCGDGWTPCSPPSLLLRFSNSK